MRKLYALLAGFLMGLAGTPLYAQIITPDVANFSFVVDAPTNNVAFTNTSTLGSIAGPRKAFWHFGDGTVQMTLPLQGTTHHYASAGNYNVCLKLYRYTSSGDSFLTAQVCKAVVIEAVCRANFEFHDSITSLTPLQYSVKFGAIPFHNANRPVTQVCWNFGDGSDTCINVSTATIPVGLLTVRHTYFQQGPFNVCVRIKYADGCVAEKCKLISWQNPPPDSCRADFERLPLTTVNNPLRVTFKALPWHNYNKRPARICWTFGDGRDTCIQYSNTNPGPYLVTHQYATPGLYEVCVKILYHGGCEARKCKPVPVGPRPDTCHADFERIPVTVATPYTQGFRALPSHNNNKKPVRICWQFGDGEDTCINYPVNYTGQYVVTHRYANPGPYEVCVKILYYGGCEARKCKPIVIPPPPVNCNVHLFEITPSINSLVRGFMAYPSSSPPRRPVRICWYFGDGEDTCIMVNPTTPLPNFFIRHTYPGPGNYRACVKVLFDGGCIAQDCREVVIRNPSNVCGGFMMDSLVAPRTIRFKGFGIHNPNDEVIGYRWTFGDGSSATGREVTHTYSLGGTFEVCLTIRTRLGCETRICKPVRVPGNNLPALQLTPNPVINVLHVSFLSTHSEPVIIRVLNGTGTAVRTYARNVTVGPNNWDHDLSNLLPGIYSYVVQSPNQLASAIFIKQ